MRRSFGEEEQPTVFDNVKKAATRFCYTTGWHQVVKVAKAKHFALQLFWFFVLLNSTLVMSYHIFNVAATYFEYKIQVSLQSREEYPVIFPAVTYCNINPIKNSSLGNQFDDDDEKDGGDSRRRAKRQAYQTSPTCCMYDDHVESQTGMCLSVSESLTPLKDPTPANFRQVCEELGVGYVPAVLDMERKADMVQCKVTEYLQTQGTDGFLMDVQDRKWGNLVGLDDGYSNFAQPEDAAGAYTYMDKNGTWLTTGEPGSLNLVPVCQKMVECPNPLFDDGDKRYCYFLYSKGVTMTFDIARQGCAKMHPDATLAKVDKEQKVNFIKDNLQKITNSTSETYWIGLSGTNEGSMAFRWVGDQDTFEATGSVYTNFGPDGSTALPGTTTHGVLVDPTKNSQWFVKQPNQKHLALCQVEGLAFFNRGLTKLCPEVPQDAAVAASERSFSKEFLKTEETFVKFQSLDDQAKKNLGYTAAEFIVDCQFKGRKCTVDDFFQWNHAIYGNCYAFNSGWDDKPLREAYRTGSKDGLKVTLNIGLDEYLSNIDNAAGARVVVHKQQTMPFPDANGIMAQPGTMLSLSVKKQFSRHIGDRQPEFGKCVKAETEEVKSLDQYAQDYPVDYSQEGCSQTCYQQAVIAQCSCYDSSYPATSENTPVCSYVNEEQRNCKTSVENKYAVGDLGCKEKCLPACIEYEYNIKTSVANWPPRNRQQQVVKKLGDKIKKLTEKFQNDSTVYAKNLLAIEVYLETFNYDELEQSLLYTPIQALSDVGAALGMWLGLSLVTLVECFQLFGVMLAAVVHSFAGKSEKKMN